MGNGKSFVIGDLHGCREMLERMLSIIPWNPEKDNLIFIGDYLDRGDDSKGVIDLLIKLSLAYPKVKCLMGNHESIFLEYLFGGDEKTFLVNGGLPTLDSYRKNSDIFIPPEHVSFIQSMVTHIELDNYYIVHAGFKPGVKIEDQGIKDMLWIRESFITSDYAFGKKVIFGHTPFYSPYVTENKIGIDTGAVFGNKLTCIELPDEKFYFVEKLP